MIRVVSPGEDISDVLAEQKVGVLGSGFVRIKDGSVLCTVAGPLFLDEGRAWIGESAKRSSPKEGDVVIGIVRENVGDHYILDIGAPRPAHLNILAFDGASRRNCPHLENGALVFARVIKSEPNFEPQISCEATGSGKKKDWTTGETQFGELKGGCVFNIKKSTCRRLSENNAPLLIALGAHIPFEVCIGFNGRVWVDAEDPQHVVLIGVVLRAAQGINLDKVQSEALVERLKSTLIPDE